MNLLVTAGNTLVLIDRVRAITNIFTGRTGAQIALHAHARGHAVTLLTSHPEAAAELHGGALPSQRWAVVPYRTFDDLQARMEECIRPSGLDAVVHCAAVSDYRADGVYAPAPATHFDPQERRWMSTGGAPLLEDRAAGKVKSSEPELWLRLVRTPKLVDRIRPQWGFAGILVKFKLEVGVSDEELLRIAEESRRQSQADLMVANTLEGAGVCAYLGPLGGGYQRLARRDLPARLLAEIERLHRGRSHG